MSAPAGIWFVYRSHDEGPLSKRVRRVEAPSVLAFFQSLIEEARISMAPRDIGKASLGGRVQGLGALFEKAKELSLHTPKSIATLKKVLSEHLAVKGGDENIIVDAHTLRVLTGDDDVGRAYAFFDDETAAKNPHRVAWLLHEAPSLPDGDADGAFRPEGVVPVLGQAGGGEGATYLAVLTFAGGESLAGTVGALPGVRLPGLAAHLRAAAPEGLPAALRRLREALEEGDATVAPALRRVGGGDAAKAIVHEGPHAALLAAHASDRFGYEQTILFDDRWAAANPDLASSILHAARFWDPFAVVQTPKPAKEPKPVKEPKAPKEPKPAAAPRSTRAPVSARAARAQADADAAVARHDAAWKKAVAGRTVEAARAYAPGERYTEGELIHHAKFGLGVVTLAGPAKIEALFAGAPRMLVHGVK